MKVMGRRLGMNEPGLRISRVAAGLCSVVAILLAGTAGAQQALTVQQNMAEQSKKHIIPGKELHARGPNYQFCEVAPMVGTSKENAVANFYNPTGIDHCTPEQFAQIEKDKEKIIKEMGAIDVFLNPSRHWAWDEFTVYQVGDERQFGPVKFAWMGVTPVEAMEKAVGKGHYHPGQIHRFNTFKYNKGTTAICSTCRTGKSWSCSLGPPTSTRARRQRTSKISAASSRSSRQAGHSE